jgi:acetyl esterase/lipase
MMRTRNFIFLSMFCLCGGTSCGTSTNFSADNPHQPLKKSHVGTTPSPAKLEEENQSSFIYKTVGATNLKIYVYQPSPSKSHQTAIVFFHGGSWTNGAPVQFQKQALNLAERGILSITVEYRLKKTNGTTPYEALADAKSAIRWVRAHSEELQIDPNKIIASGGSAGGHLAASTAIIEKHDDPDDDLTISAVPNALVLFNPVLDMQRWKKRFGIDMMDISPLQQLHKPLPPTIIFHGTSDIVAPYATTVEFVDKAHSINSPNVRLVTFAKREHSFFNKDMGDDSDFKATLKQTYDFIVSLGWASKR